MQILSTRSKVNSRRFYESFTSNKRCKSYLRDSKSNTSSSQFFLCSIFAAIAGFSNALYSLVFFNKNISSPESTDPELPPPSCRPGAPVSLSPQTRGCGLGCTPDRSLVHGPRLWRLAPRLCRPQLSRARATSQPRGQLISSNTWQGLDTSAEPISP
jgi:hypothetical protein